MRKIQKADGITAHSKSIVMGGGTVLFPINDTGIEIMTKQLKAFVAEAEIAAFDRGYAAAQLAIRRAAGLSK